MRKAILVALFVGVVIDAGAADPTIGHFAGRYTVTDVVGYDQMSGGIPAAKELLGQEVIITARSIVRGSEQCAPAGGFHVREVETTKSLLDIYAIDRESAGLPVKTVLLDSEDCPPVFRMDARRIVVGFNGVIVRAIRNDNGSPSEPR